MRIVRLGLALAVAGTLGLGLAACQKPAGDVDSARLLAAASNAEWLSYGKDYSEQRFSPLDQINTETVKDLGLAWYADFDTDRGQEATPLMVDGVLYTTTAWSKVYAFDAKTGEKKWSFDPKVDPAKGFDACCDVVNRGVAIWKGKVYVGTLDGRLIALNARDGSVAWSVQTTDNSKPYTITGAPRVVKDKVLIGNGGAEYGVRGYITAYDAASGKQVWRFFTVPNPTGAPDGAASDKVLAEKANATWSDGAWKESGGGGTAWDAMAYDPELDLMYFGIGNGNPWNHMKRSGGKGDNLFLSSILALKPDTGEYVWHYQTTPGETWDYTATQHIMLADLKIGGQDRKVLMQAPKNGFFYVLDRATGQLISAEPFAPITWATKVDLKTGRPVEAAGVRYERNPALIEPGPLGSHNWHPMAFNPKAGLVYIPAQVAASVYGDQKVYKHRQGAVNVGIDGLLTGLPTEKAQMAAIKATVSGKLVAWDPVAQKARWTVDHPYFWNAGILSTGGGLVFQGAAVGGFTAYDASTGAKLWSYKTQNGIVAPASTYEIDGEQYVALMVGYGGAGATFASALNGDPVRMPGRLMVFKLGGKAVAPEYKIPPMPKLELAGVSSAGDPKAGFAVFQDNCVGCHGGSASGGYLADLTNSQMLRAEADFKSVVIDGALKSRGMVSFAKYLSPKEAEDIRAYLLTLARAKQAQAASDSSGGR